MPHAEQFEPVFLEVETIHISEYGKRWLDERVAQSEKFNATLKDVVQLAVSEHRSWHFIQRKLDEEGVPQAITNGASQYAMSHLIDHLNGKTAFTMPVTVAMALATAAPTSTTTGATVTEAAYTGYTRIAIAGAGWNAATAATPSVATNASTITFPNCTAGTSTLLGYIIADSSTTGAGNSLWYGTLASTVISTTQTPPTVASGALSVSATGS